MAINELFDKIILYQNSFLAIPPLIAQWRKKQDKEAEERPLVTVKLNSAVKTVFIYL
jgi:hypothetical protein